MDSRNSSAFDLALQHLCAMRILSVTLETVQDGNEVPQFAQAHEGRDICHWSTSLMGGLGRRHEPFECQVRKPADKVASALGRDVPMRMEVIIRWPLQ